MIRTPVPEAAVHVDSETDSSEGDVYRAAPVSRNLDLHPKPQPPAVEGSPQVELGLSIAP